MANFYAPRVCTHTAYAISALCSVISEVEQLEVDLHLHRNDLEKLSRTNGATSPENRWAYANQRIADAERWIASAKKELEMARSNEWKLRVDETYTTACCCPQQKEDAT